MAWSTLAGSAVGDVASAGMIELTEGSVLHADDINFDLRDIQHIAKRQLLSGVIVSGVLTAVGLVITFPSGFTYFAGQMWTAGASTTFTVADNATSYLWGCSDGVIRSTTSAGTPPTSFDGRTACLLVKAVSVSGVVTLDTSVRQHGRIADSTGRFVGENNAGLYPQSDTIPATAVAVIPAGTQVNLRTSFTNAGTVILQGRLRVDG